jgi:AcrR family transcriptional regulator
MTTAFDSATEAAGDERGRRAEAAGDERGRRAEAAGDEPGRGGRRAEAARNDERILESARAVFVADPGAPISAVAEHAGVGVGALYRRYPSKEELLRKLCADGLQRFIAAAEAALADHGDPWKAFAGFMRRCVDSDTNSLTQRLAGTFTPTEALYREAGRAQGLLSALFERTQAAGAIRADLEVGDVGLLLEQVAAVRIGDARRTSELRHRYLALQLDAIRPLEAEPLPGPAPGWEELSARWNP